MCLADMQTIYDPIFISLYNVVFTSLPILVVGIFEQDVPANDGIKYPYLYEAGLVNALFSYGQFMLSLLKGAIHSIIIFFVSFCAFRLGGQVCWLTLCEFVPHCVVDSLILHASMRPALRLSLTWRPSARHCL